MSDKNKKSLKRGEIQSLEKGQMKLTTMFKGITCSNPKKQCTSDSPSKSPSESESEITKSTGESSATEDQREIQASSSSSISTETETMPDSFSSLPESLDPATYIGKYLSDEQKRTILSSKRVPDKDKFSYPVTNGRRYKACWEDTFTWLRYSRSLDSAFCAPCVAFAQNKSGYKTEKFCSSGMNDWKNAVGAKRGTLLIHQESSCHQDALKLASHFMRINTGEEKNIKCSISKTYEDNVRKNREIVLSIIDVVIALGQRNIPFRGHSWDKDTKREDGNFDFFVNWKAEDKPVLRSHLESASYNAKYMSPDIQNEIINIASDEVLEVILEKARSSKWFSIMADECTDVANIEQMAVCIRYVDDKNNVNEEFIGFVPLDKVDAESITTALVKKMTDCKLELCNMRGQGYDGASVMSGLKSGVSARIKEMQPLAEYHHCRAHALNLVISSSCKSVAMIRTVFDDINQLTWFLAGSPKRTAILKRHLPDSKQMNYLVGDTDDGQVESNKNISGAFGKKLLPKLCETRWSARVDTLSVILAKYKAILDSLEDVKSESTATEARTKATGFIHLMERSTFIVALVIAHHILSYTKPLNLALQNSKCDVHKAFVDAQTCKQTITNQRSDDVYDRCIWAKSVAIAESIGVELTKPRTVGRMTHRSNAAFADGSVSSYYRINAYFPFIDHCVGELGERFPEQGRPSFAAFQLLPNRVKNITDLQLQDVKKRFETDLPDTMGFQAELDRWKVLCATLPESEINESTLEKAIELADSDYYPNVHVIFRLLLTMPVGSVPCERSFSAMRQLKHWSRSTMKDDRLAGLACLYIHRDISISKENVLKVFDSAKKRRLGPLQF